MDITSAVLSGVNQSMDFSASMTKKADAMALLAGTLTGASSGSDPLTDVVLESTLANGGGAAGMKLLAAQETGIGTNVDTRA